MECVRRGVFVRVELVCLSGEGGQYGDCGNMGTSNLTAIHITADGFVTSILTASNIGASNLTAINITADVFVTSLLNANNYLHIVTSNLREERGQ
jgi:hypothetical protein